MKNISSKIIAAGLLLAGAASTPQLRAQLTEVTISGGNASSAVVWQAFTNQFQNATLLSGPNNSSTVHSYQGYLSSLPGTSPNVQINFILNGAVGGLQDIVYQNVETNALGIATNVPVAVISSTTPEAVGLSSSVFTEVKTLVAPYAFIKSPVAALTPGLTLVTNLTQREANYLEGSAGPGFHSAYIGGTNTSDSVYFVGRNTASAVRTETDANIYFTGTLATYTTSNGLPVLDPAGGQTGGSGVRVLVNSITNAIGTVAAEDIKTNIALSYEGVPYSVTNVQNGLYPLWGYEHYYWLKGSGTGTPSPAQNTVLTNLLAGVTNATFQATSPVFVGNFVPYNGLNVSRPFDGGPITWLH
jgi:hypothetical protein